jgi:hypothetical protein
MNPWRRYREYRRGEFIVIFADTASGGSDYCAGQFLSKTYLDIPTVYHTNVTATEMTPAIKDEAEYIFDVTGVKPVVAYERNNGGMFEMDRLNSLNRLQKYRIYTLKTIDPKGVLVDSGKFGWDTNSATRPKMLADGKDMIEKHLINIYDRPTVTEMFSFVVVKHNNNWKAEAEVGEHDDLLMALFGVWQMYQTENPIQSNLNLLSQLPNDDIPKDARTFSITAGVSAARPDSSNPMGRTFNPDIYLPNDSPFDARGIMR